MASKPEVFIIESLTFGDEAVGRLDGRAIKQMLRLTGKSPRYFYIRTVAELKSVLKKFDASGYRYLHLSCHANDESLATTLDSIDFDDFAAIIRPHLKGRRLFISACSMVNENLAKRILPGSGCYSILGPRTNIGFSHSAVFWSSFYHLMFDADFGRMKGDALGETAQKAAELFSLRLNYFRWKNGSLKSRQIGIA